MTVLDTVFATLVDVLLNKSGLAPAATLVKKSGGYIPELDRAAPGASNSYSINVTPPEAVVIRDQSGQTTVTGTLKVTCQGVLTDGNGNAYVDGQGNPVQPQINDLLVFNNTAYRIDSVMPMYSGEDIASFELEVKR